MIEFFNKSLRNSIIGCNFVVLKMTTNKNTNKINNYKIMTQFFITLCVDKSHKEWNYSLGVDNLAEFCPVKDWTWEENCDAEEDGDGQVTLEFTRLVYHNQFQREKAKAFYRLFYENHGYKLNENLWS